MDDKLKKYLDIVRPHLTEHRYTHTLGVLQTAEQLNRQYGGNLEAIQIAAILHDIAKFWDAERLKNEIIQHHLGGELLGYDKETWHAPVGAAYVKRELGITDDLIVESIRNHTVGRAGMGIEEKIIWLSDYIEPGRHFPGVDEVREIAKVNLDEALLSGLDRTITFLIKQKKKIHPNTFETRNWFIELVKDNKEGNDE